MYKRQEHLQVLKVRLQLEQYYLHNKHIVISVSYTHLLGIGHAVIDEGLGGHVDLDIVAGQILDVYKRQEPVLPGIQRHPGRIQPPQFLAHRRQYDDGLRLHPRCV